MDPFNFVNTQPWSCFEQINDVRFSTENILQYLVPPPKQLSFLVDANFIFLNPETFYKQFNSWWGFILILNNLHPVSLRNLSHYDL